MIRTTQVEHAIEQFLKCDECERRFLEKEHLKIHKETPTKYDTGGNEVPLTQNEVPFARLSWVIIQTSFTLELSSVLSNILQT